MKKWLATWTTKWRSWTQNEEGGALLILTFFVITAIGVGAIVVDVGKIYTSKLTIQDKAEAVALAAVQEILQGAEAAKRVGEEYAIANQLSAAILR